MLIDESTSKKVSSDKSSVNQFVNPETCLATFGELSISKTFVCVYRCDVYPPPSHAAFPANGRSITEVDALPAESFLSIQLMISNGLF